MLLQRCFAGIVIFRVEVALIGHQRHFGVDNHIFALRQTNNDIRLHSRARIVFNADLRFVFVSFTQARGLQHARHDHFAPVSLRFVITFQCARQVNRLLSHLRIQLLEITDLMRQRVALASLLTKAVLHLTAKAVQLFTQRRQQAVQALAVLLIHAAIAVLKNAVRKVLKLLAKTLLAVDHLTDFVFGVQLGGFKAGGHFPEIGLQRGVNVAQIAQFVIEQFTLIAPVVTQRKLLFRRAEFGDDLFALCQLIGFLLSMLVAANEPANPHAHQRNYRINQD